MELDFPGIFNLLHLWWEYVFIKTIQHPILQGATHYFLIVLTF